MAMRAGKPVYIEKPLAASYEDCARINRISEQTGVPCFVAYYRRFLPYFQKVKSLVKDGAKPEPGCEIVIPSKKRKKGVDWTMVAGVMSGLTGIAAIMLAISRL